MAEDKNMQMEVKKEEIKVEEPKENLEQKVEKKEAPKKQKKEESVARGLNLHASKKHSMYICNFIKGKSVDLAIKELNDVINLKRAIPFKGEIPHRKGMMSGRYPVKTSEQFIPLLKALKGNILANGMDLDKTTIAIASANWSSRPQRRGGGRFKRTNVILIAKEIAK